MSRTALATSLAVLLDLGAYSRASVADVQAATGRVVALLVVEPTSDTYALYHGAISVGDSIGGFAVYHWGRFVLPGQGPRRGNRRIAPSRPRQPPRRGAAVHQEWARRGAVHRRPGVHPAQRTGDVPVATEVGVRLAASLLWLLTAVAPANAVELELGDWVVADPDANGGSTRAASKPWPHLGAVEIESHPSIATPFRVSPVTHASVSPVAIPVS